MKYQIIIADNNEKLENGEKYCTNSKEKLWQMMCECLENGKAFSAERIKDRKLYCLHVFNSWMFPNLCLCSPYKAIKDFKLDEKFIKKELENNPIMIIGADVDEYGASIDKADDDIEMDYFFFSYDLGFIKNQAKKEIEYRIPVLESSIKALKDVDIENLLDISKEQENE